MKLSGKCKSTAIPHQMWETANPCGKIGVTEITDTIIIHQCLTKLPIPSHNTKIIK